MVDFPGHSFDGATLIEDDERQGLLLEIETRGQLNIAEANNIDRAFLKYINPKRKLSLSVLLKESFAKRFHKECFGEVWEWAGKYRTVATMPGIDWYQIPTAMNQLMLNTKAQFDHMKDKSDSAQKELIAAEFAYRIVVIHPFRNGNGRWSRGYTDLLCDVLEIERFTWGASIADENERHNQMIKALNKADSTSNIDQFMKWAKS